MGSEGALPWASSQPSDWGCRALLLAWGLGHMCTNPQGILRLNVTLRNAVTSLLFKYIFSPLPVIKVQGRDASFLVDICFDS